MLAVVIPLIVGAWLATPRGLLRRHRARRRPRRDDLPRAAVRAAVRDRALRDLLRVRRAARGRARRRAATASPTTSCARATTPRTWSSGWRRARSSERSQPRAARARPRLAAAHRRLRGDLHPAVRGALRRLADLRRRLPRAVPVRAPRDPRDAAVRRPVPVPARRGAGVLRARRDLPDRRDARARAGAVVRRRARAVRDRRSCSCATSACSSATATRSPPPGCSCSCCRACPGSASRSTAPTSASAIGPISFQPAEFGKIAIVIFLAAYLRDTRQMLVQGSRRIAGVTIPPLKHFGPLLVVWGGAMVMLVFIRDLGSSLMFFGGFLALLYVATNRALVRRDRARAVRARGVVLRQHRRPRAEPHRHVARPVRPRALRGATAAPTRSRSRCSRRPTAGCSAPASARR